MGDVAVWGTVLAAPCRATAGSCKVIVPLTAPTAAELAGLAITAAEAADLLEVRLDALETLTPRTAAQALAAVRRAAPKRAILATVRTAREGGPADLTAEAYAALLRGLCDEANGGFDLLDVEFSVGKHLRETLLDAAHQAGAAVVFSCHDFARTPETEAMADLLVSMADAGADVAKLAVMPQCPADAARLLEATARAAALRPETPLITMAMGAMGAVTRLCGGAFGVCASFGAMGGAASAPGQPDARDLRAAVAAVGKAMQ
nr:type I 3-dehydroquinate dehydratase [uncultured Gemmiger sp.]